MRILVDDTTISLYLEVIKIFLKWAFKLVCTKQTTLYASNIYYTCNIFKNRVQGDTRFFTYISYSNNQKQYPKKGY